MKFESKKSWKEAREITDVQHVHLMANFIPRFMSLFYTRGPFSLSLSFLHEKFIVIKLNLSLPLSCCIWDVDSVSYFIDSLLTAELWFILASFSIFFNKWPLIYCVGVVSSAIGFAFFSSFSSFSFLGLFPLQLPPTVSYWSAMERSSQSDGDGCWPSFSLINHFTWFGARFHLRQSSRKTGTENDPNGASIFEYRQFIWQALEYVSNSPNQFRYGWSNNKPIIPFQCLTTLMESRINVAATGWAGHSSTSSNAVFLV